MKKNSESKKLLERRPMKRTALYLRVDKIETLKNGQLNIELQEEMLRDYCKEKGYIVTAVYSDYNEETNDNFYKSKYMLPWGDLNNLIEEYHEDPNRKWERIVVFDLDRISPDPRILSSMLCLMTQHELYEPIIVESMCNGIYGKDFDLAIVHNDRENEDILIDYNEFEN